MYNSFAIWYDKKPSQGSEELCAELHFNLWQFSFQSKKSLDCLDIGIKLEKITSCSSIKLFIPFEIGTFEPEILKVNYLSFVAASAYRDVTHLL